jgi:hypothetical protein
MTLPYMQYQHGETVFRWHGGAYIDVGGVYSVDGQPGIHGDDFHAYDVINVWDYATDTPRIERTLAAFQERCDEYMAEQDSES